MRQERYWSEAWWSGLSLHALNKAWIGLPDALSDQKSGTGVPWGEEQGAADDCHPEESLVLVARPGSNLDNPVMSCRSRARPGHWSIHEDIIHLADQN